MNFNELPEGQRVSEDEVIAQQGDWGTDMDIHYIKQLYRDCGWPDAFRRDEAFDAVDKLMDKIRDHRYEWEIDDFDGGGEGHWC